MASSPRFDFARIAITAPPALERPSTRAQAAGQSPADAAERQANVLGARIAADLGSMGSIGSGPLPSHVAAVAERHLGASVAGTEIHAGSDGNARARAAGAPAVTEGTTVSFGAGELAGGSGRSREMLGHELTHVAQQRRHGPAVQPFTSFSSADETAGNSLGWTHPSSTGLLVADDGMAVVEDLGWGSAKRAWTTDAKLKKANDVLAAQGSKVKLTTGPDAISGHPPDKPAASLVMLTEVVPQNASGGGPFGLTPDCGTACKEVSGNPLMTEESVAVLKGPKKEQYTASQLYHGGNPTTPEQWSEEIFKKEFGSGLSRADAYKKYDALSAADKDAFDKKYGLNKHAAPTWGQGMTTSTEKDMPGFKTMPGHASDTWNFHFAAAIIAGSADYVTLENVAGATAADWFFWMYGPASKKQSFHEFHGATGQHGNKFTSMVVEPAKVLDTSLKTDASMVKDAGGLQKLTKGTDVHILEKFSDATLLWARIEVKSGPNAGLTGSIQRAFLVAP